MATPFLVVVAASHRKERASPRPGSLRASLKGCWKLPVQPHYAGSPPDLRPGFPDRHAQKFFLTVVKISTAGSEKKLAQYPLQVPIPFQNSAL
ncbi:hypothetical protein M3I53_19330 [Paraburkholderia sp. CNPSo 3272]|nr:hypothetical protein [Paraburkholderia sp. CNPSo 3272]